MASNSTAAIRKRGGCFDSDNNSIDFAIGNPVPRNSAAGVRSCVPVPAAMHDVQGNGFVSPFAGQDVLTSGIVTGIKSNGFFLQSPDGAADSDPATSEGIFVFTAVAPAVTVGGQVGARGTVSEFFGLTQIESLAARRHHRDRNGAGASRSGSVDDQPFSIRRDRPIGSNAFEGMRMTLLRSRRWRRPTASAKSELC